MAALTDKVLLDQVLDGHEWLGIAVVVLANAAAVTTFGPAATARSVGDDPAETMGPVTAGAARTAVSA